MPAFHFDASERVVMSFYFGLLVYGDDRRAGDNEALEFDL